MGQRDFLSGFYIFKRVKLVHVVPRTVGFGKQNLSNISLMLMSATQVVSLHCNLDEHTHHLMNKARLEMMKPNGILINAARGQVVDEAALVAHLKANPEFRYACYQLSVPVIGSCYLSCLSATTPRPPPPNFKGLCDINL